MRDDGLLAKNLVGNEWNGHCDNTVDIFNPSTGERSGSFAPATQADLDAAVDNARRAFETDGWADEPQRRAVALLRMAQVLADARETIIPVAVAESGKRTVEVRAELNLAISELQYYAGIARNIWGRAQEMGGGGLSVLSREAIGVSAIIVPWNAPIALLIRSLAPALAAGCTVIVKPAPQTSLTNARIVSAFSGIEELPPSVVQSLNENGDRIGKGLVLHKEVDVISFTGSRTTAGHIAANAAQTLKRLNLELGGKSPAILFSDVDLSRAVAGIVQGATIAAGQQCTAVSRILVNRSIFANATHKLSQALEAIKIGAADDPRSQMGPVVNSASVERLERLAKSHAQAAVLLGKVSSDVPPHGCYVAPSLIAVTDCASQIVQEEHFGPVLTLESFEDEEEAIAKANATAYGLAASVWTASAARAQRLARALKFGTVWINCHNRLFAEIETGGFKQSGIGRLHGPQALDCFLESKHVFSAAIDLQGDT